MQVWPQRSAAAGPGAAGLDDAAAQRLEVCHNLRADRHLDAVPVVMLTARGSEADIEWGYAAGADAYIVKPFSPRALVWRIESMLSKGRYPLIVAGPED